MENIIFTSKKVFLDGDIRPASVVVQNGKIVSILTNDKQPISGASEVIDVGDDLIMPGVVDSHVHVNEPGRTMWEGYATATKAAAAGGATTIIDMPLNCIPSTVSLSAFRAKVNSAERKCHVNVGFWGGIVPGNHTQLIPMLNAGVLGFKCFLIHSGVDEFPMVTSSDLETAFQTLQGTDAVVLFHAEVDCGCQGPQATSAAESPTEYETFLSSRPDVMETEAIKLVCNMCVKYRVRCHIVHLSSASALPLIVDTKRQGAPLTVETCHHYLSLEAENIPSGATQYKCCPPIRDKQNQDTLWEALRRADIDMVVSDHSPCTPDLKHLGSGNFMTAWGGIASVQFGLSLFWTNAVKRGMDLSDLVRLLCENTAQMAGLTHKGFIRPGYDADFVIWDPDSTYKVEEKNIYHRNKLTPYLGRELRGVVKKTVVGGSIVFEDGKFVAEGRGKLLYKNKTALNAPIIEIEKQTNVLEKDCRVP